MKEFLFTSSLFEGFVRFGYTDGVLTSFESQAKLNEEQIKFFSTFFPFEQKDLERIKGKNGRIEEVITDLSFENFWNRYGHKVDKAQAEKFWLGMSKEQKSAAINGINRYKFKCKERNTPLVYPIRYLRNKRWQDE